ncbi:MAG: amidohydrolase family protein, partial [Candidatus Ranarchaeia archaeon]
MTDILLYNGFIITMNPRREIIRDGAVAIENGKIVAIGKTVDVKHDYPHAEHEIDASNHAVLPGFINTHAHNFQVLLKSLGDDMKLMDWAPQVIVPITRELGKEECYWAGMASSIESIRGGITTTVDFHYCHKDWDNADHILESYVKTGIRGIESRCVQDEDRFGL